MRFEPTPIAGLTVVETDRHGDERGTFSRVWCAEELTAAGLDPSVAQVSLSTNATAGTRRGMHWQRPPHGEAKLVRCVQGAIFDVAVDLRPDSPTRLEWFGIELSAETGRALFLPEGMAHGFQTPTDDSAVLYLISTPYAGELQDGLPTDDPDIGIEWPGPAVVMSDRDRAMVPIANRSHALWAD